MNNFLEQVLINECDVEFLMKSMYCPDQWTIGQDSTWISLGTQHHIHLSELAPGNYSLYVKAKNNDGFEIPKQLLISFTVFPPYYKTWLSLIHISEPTRQAEISYAVFCLK